VKRQNEKPNAKMKEHGRMKKTAGQKPGVEQNTFAEYLFVGGMQRDTAYRLSEFFEMKCQTQLRFITKSVIDDIEGGCFSDASGDLVLSAHELDQLRTICEFYRKGQHNKHTSLV
jgi:hypothetical protein